MTDAEVQMAAKAAIEWANKGYWAAYGAEVQIRAAEEGRVTSEKAWDRDNPDDGVGCMGMNPFRDKRTHVQRLADGPTTREEQAYRNTKRWETIQKFVQERLCDMLKGDEDE